MIRITITAEAYRALGGEDKPPRQSIWERACDEGGYYLWLTPGVAAKLSNARAPGEDYSAVILRLAQEEVAR